MIKYSDILSTKIVKEKVDEAIKNSKKSGKEYGFNICLRECDITATEVIRGNKYSIILENICPGVKIGSFHVHPMSQDASPSPKDLANLEENGYEKFVCIGVNIKNTNGRGEDRKIKCFDNEDSKPDSYFWINV
jgi:hypothetical protein